MLCTCKHRLWTPTALVRTIPETFKGLGLSQQTAFCPQKAMLASLFTDTYLHKIRLKNTQHLQEYTAIVVSICIYIGVLDI